LLVLLYTLNQGVLSRYNPRLPSHLTVKTVDFH